MAKPNLRKPATTQTRQPPSVVPVSPELEGLYPNLYAYMTQDAWEDGGTRATTTVLFFFERGEMKLCVSDRDLQRSFFVTGSDFASLLETAEAMLENGEPDWRQKRLAR